MSIHSTGSPIVTNSRINVVNREPLYANDVVDTVPIPSKREYPAARAKRFDRGRRDYADENDRPVQHVARGISNVTDYTNTMYVEFTTVPAMITGQSLHLIGTDRVVIDMEK